MTTLTFRKPTPQNKIIPLLRRAGFKELEKAKILSYATTMGYAHATIDIGNNKRWAVMFNYHNEIQEILDI